MPQVLEVNVPIQIPAEYKLIKTSEYDDLKATSMVGRMWTMQDLRNWISGKSPDWIKDNILFNPQYADEIQRMRDKREIVGGGRGSQYHFKASAMAAFIERHHSELNWEG